MHNSPEQNARNVMGLDRPVPYDPAEFEAKQRETQANIARIDAINRKAREAKSGEFTPAAITNRNKIKLYELRQNAKNAEVRLNEYGVPDVRHWTEIIAKALADRKAAGDAGALQEERRLELYLQKAEAELVQAHARLERFRKENSAAVAARKSFEEEIASVREAPLSRETQSR